MQKEEGLSTNEFKLRLTFARKFKRELPKNFWIKGVGFYLDAASSVNKINLFDQARDPKGMIWRNPKQGWNFGFTTKAITKAMLELLFPIYGINNSF